MFVQVVQFDFSCLLWSETGYMQLLSALPRCASSTVSDVGYPSNCGVVYGSFGDPRAHEDGHGRFCWRIPIWECLNSQPWTLLEFWKVQSSKNNHKLTFFCSHLCLVHYIKSECSFDPELVGLIAMGLMDSFRSGLSFLAMDPYGSQMSQCCGHVNLFEVASRPSIFVQSQWLDGSLPSFLLISGSGWSALRPLAALALAHPCRSLLSGFKNKIATDVHNDCKVFFCCFCWCLDL